MKAPAITLLAALAGFAIGFGVRPKPAASAESGAAKELPRKSSPDARRWSAAKLAPGQRMQGIAAKAATLGRAEWPGFFRSQLGSPETSRLAARLWAEADPGGFWTWLREAKDPILIDRFAEDLARVWAAADPDAAMSGVLQVTDKELGDRLRREVVDFVIERNLAKGLEFAARAGDFNRFGWGPREWMKKDPEAAVRGLAGLPAVSDYRHFLNYALPIWIESDPAGALEWMKAQAFQRGDRWEQDGFEAAAKADPQSALAAARGLEDPRQREAALLGIVASGTLATGELQDLLGELPLKTRAQIGSGILKSRPSETAADLAAKAELVAMLPSSRNTQNAVKSLAWDWDRVDSQAGWQWAASLPDAAQRRIAYANLAASQMASVAALPMVDLSDELFRHVFSRLADDQEDGWIRGLPVDHAAWARSVKDESHVDSR